MRNFRVPVCVYTYSLGGGLTFYQAAGAIGDNHKNAFTAADPVR
jgi:hypothetical protein